MGRDGRQWHSFLVTCLGCCCCGHMFFVLPTIMSMEHKVRLSLTLLPLMPLLSGLRVFLDGFLLMPICIFNRLLEQLVISCHNLHHMLAQVLSHQLVDFLHQKLLLQLSVDSLQVCLLKCHLDIVPSSVSHDGLYPDGLLLRQHLIDVVSDKEDHGQIRPEVSAIEECRIPQCIAHLLPILDS